jgi:hypothetical protein
MKECDNSKIHISSNFILSINLLIMFDTLLLRLSLHCNTPLHFTTLHPTTLHYTSLHFTTFHPSTLHYTSLHFTHQHFTTLHPSTLHGLANVECIRGFACNVKLTENSTSRSTRRGFCVKAHEKFLCVFVHVGII